MVGLQDRNRHTGAVEQRILQVLGNVVEFYSVQPNRGSSMDANERKVWNKPVLVELAVGRTAGGPRALGIETNTATIPPVPYSMS